MLPFYLSFSDLLIVHPTSIIGLVIVSISLGFLLRNRTLTHKVRTIISSLLFYCYLVLSLTNVFGIPTVMELSRLTSLGQPLFNPNLEMMPLADGFSFSFILNVIAFMPFGFLVPMISPTYSKWYKTVLLGFLFSLSIEVSQLFTLYRATDINDLLTNTFGTVLGYLCFTIINKLIERKRSPSLHKDPTRVLPPFIVAIAFLSVILIWS